MAGVIVLTIILLVVIYGAIWKTRVKPAINSEPKPINLRKPGLPPLYVSRWINEDGEVIEFAKPRPLAQLEEERARRRRVAIAAVDPNILR